MRKSLAQHILVMAWQSVRRGILTCMEAMILTVIGIAGVAHREKRER